MKMNIEIDCSPEEARRFLGLPDVTEANQAYAENMAKLMSGAGSLDQLQELGRQMAPMGQMGLKFFQDMMESGVKANFSDASQAQKSSDKPKK